MPERNSKGQFVKRDRIERALEIAERHAREFEMVAEAGECVPPGLSSVSGWYQKQMESAFERNSVFKKLGARPKPPSLWMRFARWLRFKSRG